MSFGRQRNMTRRASRPDEGFHRDRRRKTVDRAVMLEARFAKPKPSLLKRMLMALRLFKPE